MATSVGKNKKSGKAAVPEKVRLRVNGRDIEVPRTHPEPTTGAALPTTMIQACALAGVEVPHYCYHPCLPVAGNCRMCLVEFALPALGPDRQPLLNEDGTVKMVHQTLPYDRATPRVAIACATPVSPGMEILTETPYLKKVREGILESLLINHPLDCPICDQAGECKLQEYAMEHGTATSRFVEAKVHKPKQVDLGPRIMLDGERCILCSRCIRFTRDIVGDDALGIVNRGSYNTIATYPGRPFDNNYTLNTVDLCPVGALTSKDFRFQMRVWFLKETKSVCTTCATGCNIVVGSRENRIYRYEPRVNEAVNSHWMCDHGRLNYKWIGREDRLTAPVRRRGGAPSEPVSWSEMLGDLSARLAAVEKGTLAIVASARQTTEELYLLSRLAKRLGAVTDSIPREGEADHLLVVADKNPNMQGARLTGIVANMDPGQRMTEIAEGIREGRIRGLVVFGEDVTERGIEGSLLESLELLVVGDLFPTETTRRAHYVLPGCAVAEKRGTLVNVRGRVQRFMQAVEPPGQARPEWEVLLELEKRMTGVSEVRSIEGLFHRMAGELGPLTGLRWSDLGDQGRDIAV